MNFELSKEQKRNIAHNLKMLRIENNLSQEAFAKIMEVTRNSILNYESGKTIPGSLEFLKLHEYFKVSFKYLYGETISKYDIQIIESFRGTLNDEFFEYIGYIETTLKNAYKESKDFVNAYMKLQVISNLINKSNDDTIQKMANLLFANFSNNTKNSKDSKEYMRKNFGELIADINYILCDKRPKEYNWGVDIKLKNLVNIKSCEFDIDKRISEISDEE